MSEPKFVWEKEVETPPRILPPKELLMDEDISLVASYDPMVLQDFQDMLGSGLQDIEVWYNWILTPHGWLVKRGPKFKGYVSKFEVSDTEEGTPEGILTIEITGAQPHEG